VGSPAAGDGYASSQAFELRFEYANENRQATINLGATGVAILTFLLIFFSGRYGSGSGSDLFRVTLACVVVSIFFLGVSGSFYYFLIEALERKRPDAPEILVRADVCFVIGLALLLLEPALILITVGILDVGLLALVLWAASLVVIGHGRAKYSRSPAPGPG
jgi:hypothetical protein